jgi:hypothetical protein
MSDLFGAPGVTNGWLSALMPVARRAGWLGSVTALGRGGDTAVAGLVDDITARMQPGGRDDWLRWSRALGEDEDEVGPVVSMLMAEADDQIGLSIVRAMKK